MNKLMIVKYKERLGNLKPMQCRKARKQIDKKKYPFSHE